MEINLLNIYKDRLGREWILIPVERNGNLNAFVEGEIKAHLVAVDNGEWFRACYPDRYGHWSNYLPEQAFSLSYRLNEATTRISDNEIIEFLG